METIRGKICGSATVPARALQQAAEKDPECNGALRLVEYPDGYTEFTVRVPGDVEHLPQGTEVQIGD